MAGDADGIRADASCLVVKVRDGKNFSLSLPAGGEAHYGAHHLQAGPKPLCLAVKDDNPVATAGTDLMGRK